MEVINTINKLFADCIAEKKIFLYNSDNIKAVGFLNGLKHEKLKELKDLLKKYDYEYSYVYECYLNKNSRCNDLEFYREEKNDFIESLISWKFGKNEFVNQQISI